MALTMNKVQLETRVETQVEMKKGTRIMLMTSKLIQQIRKGMIMIQ